jgi:hypothetical protein
MIMPDLHSTTTKPAATRWADLRALLAWIGQSWRRPAGSVAAWAQSAGRERATSRPVAPPGSGVAPGKPGAATGAGQAPANR